MPDAILPRSEDASFTARYGSARSTGREDCHAQVSFRTSPLRPLAAGVTVAFGFSIELTGGLGRRVTEQAATFDQLTIGDDCVLIVGGELDAASAESFADAAYPHINTEQNLVFDLASASFMDSSGLKVLALVAAARTDCGGVLVRNPCPQIRRLLKVAGMSHVVTVEPPLDHRPALG